MMSQYKIFDGHNDLLYHLHNEGDLQGASFFSGRSGALDLAKCRAGGFAGGLFAIFVPGDDLPGAAVKQPVGADKARRITFEMAAILLRMTRAAPDTLRLCTTARQIDDAREAGAIAAVMHLEGAEAIGPDFGELEMLHAAGLRSLGPVWSRSNLFGHGVPFAFPSTGDIGPGLTPEGLRLVAECERLRILIDLSHLNEAGFNDVAQLSSRPLLASHSCAHGLGPHSRNLTDRQLSMIAESDGLVGLNFGTRFLRADGQVNADTPITGMVEHLKYLIDRVGETGVALGSDFDGTVVPQDLGTAAGLPKLIEAMQNDGFGAALIERICWQNWVQLFRRAVG